MAKNRYKQAKKVFSIPLGAGCRRFESCHSDHLSQKNRLKKRLFKVFWSECGDSNPGPPAPKLLNKNFSTFFGAL